MKDLQTTANLVSGLDLYTGPFGFSEAAHLLRRISFSFSREQVNQAVSDGFTLTMSKIMSQQSMPEPPVYYNFNNDPNAGNGETWVDTPHNIFVLGLNGARNRSLAAWTTSLMFDPEPNIREKMCQFWHNHFVVEAGTVSDPRFLYRYISLLRENATGNFKDLVKAITIDPAMLRYLNGNQNTVGAANENYARELLELFTIGKGALSGPGDYTTFTEDDVKEVAKVLTGWRDRGYFNILGVPIESEFLYFQHDKTSKQLSHRFGNMVIEDGAELEYAQLIDIIFQQEEVSKFICRKLYRWFVFYNIDEQIEQEIIEPLAIMLRDNDYEILPVLTTLLSSDHFFSLDQRGCMIKNPYDYIISLIKGFEVEFSGESDSDYDAWHTFYIAATALQMQYYNPPSVSGWQAYYQAPAFYQIWLNSNTLPLRSQAADLMIYLGFTLGGHRYFIDDLKFISTIEDADDPNVLIETLASIIFCREISSEQVLFLKEVLIPGLPDFEWTTEYNAYLNDPTNELLKLSVSLKVKALLSTMIKMPEFQLI
jgi:uncharacterized protein (DUF1800 family)